MSEVAIVITTINAPTRAVIDFAEAGSARGIDLILIGDEISPPDFHQEGAQYLDIAAQRASGFDYGRIAPTRHYARKNVGYLVAIERGAKVIIDTDDDNIPVDSFWAPREAHVEARLLEGSGWVNVYGYFADQPIWPRGLPLDQVLQTLPALPASAEPSVYCPIQQGLADGNPDVDAIFRLVMPLPFSFKESDPVALGTGAWCPYNSQNTTTFADAFPLLYLPYYCSFRMTDIWRSFVAQRIAHVNGWAILFHNATVFQERNEHNLMRDFADEVSGYLHNDEIRTALDALDLPAGIDAIPEAMRLAYRKLVEMELVGDGELALLDAWLADLDRLTRAA
jgi:hypothetical protein